MSSRRLFIALWPDAHTARQLHAWARRAHAACGGRLMRQDTLHLTLVFLGSVEDRRIPDLQALIREQSWAGGSLRLDCFGYFRGPRIVWAGPSAPAPWLNDLQAALRAALSGLGFEPPDERFKPHVSLLRRADVGGVCPLSVDEPLVWTPETCVLVASTPRESGSYYEPLAHGRVIPAGTGRR